MRQPTAVVVVCPGLPVLPLWWNARPERSGIDANVRVTLSQTISDMSLPFSSCLQEIVEQVPSPSMAIMGYGREVAHLSGC